MSKKSSTEKADKASIANEPKPMDDSVREQAVGTPATNTQRVCWAVKTLVQEVTSLFPETEVTYGNYDGRNTALSATFDLIGLDEPDQSDFKTLLLALPIEEHKRVASIEVLDNLVLVVMHPSARTKDIREPFALPEAWSLLTDDDEPFDSTDPAPDWATEDGHQIVKSEVDGVWADGWAFDKTDAENVLGGSL